MADLGLAKANTILKENIPLPTAGLKTFGYQQGGYVEAQKKETETQLTSEEDALKKTEENLAAAEKTLTNLNNSIATLNSEISQLNSDINSTKNDISSLNSQISSLNSQIEVEETRLKTPILATPQNTIVAITDDPWYNLELENYQKSIENIKSSNLTDEAHIDVSSLQLFSNFKSALNVDKPENNFKIAKLKFDLYNAWLDKYPTARDYVKDEVPDITSPTMRNFYNYYIQNTSNQAWKARTEKYLSQYNTKMGQLLDIQARS